LATAAQERGKKQDRKKARKSAQLSSTGARARQSAIDGQLKKSQAGRMRYLSLVPHHAALFYSKKLLTGKTKSGRHDDETTDHGLLTCRKPHEADYQKAANSGDCFGQFPSFFFNRAD
jgi:hypothetical protein